MHEVPKKWPWRSYKKSKGNYFVHLCLKRKENKFILKFKNWKVKVWNKLHFSGEKCVNVSTLTWHVRMFSYMCASTHSRTLTLCKLLVIFMMGNWGNTADTHRTKIYTSSHSLLNLPSNWITILLIHPFTSLSPQSRIILE